MVIRFTHLAVVALLWSACAVFGVSYRVSSGSDRIYITGPGSATLSDVKAGVPKADLHQVSPGVWHLRQNLVVEEGARLVLHGTKIGGDVNQLRLQSNNTGNSNDLVYLSADWGAISIRSTAITSWDDAVNGPDLEYDLHGRAFIRIRSKQDTNTLAALESRMDIIDSDVGYLGSHRPESYGLVWKVLENKVFRPYGAITNLFSIVNVYGDIMRSRIHHNYFGMYSYGSYGQIMVDNEVDHNVGYGFDPHDDSDFLVIERNNVHHNGTHGIIASQRCNNLIVRNNVSWANGNNGIMLHRYCDNSLVEGNRSFGNGDAGIALFDTRNTIVRSNVCQGNFTAGIRLSVGADDNLIIDNEFSDSPTYGIYLYKGVDAPFPGDNGHCKRNQFVNNWVHNNQGPGIFLTTCDDNVFSRNIFDANGSVMWFINGLRNRIESNAIPRTIVVRTQGTAALPASTLARNQPALSIQLDNFSTFTFTDTNAYIFDPEEPGLATTVNPAGSSLLLTTIDIAKTSFIQMRNFQVIPDVEDALVTVTIWNTTGDLSKRWFTQASSSTTRITYRVGDLTPGVRYRVLKDAVATSYTADAAGTITFQDNDVSTGVTEFMVLL
ncbi:MAG TPA: right-handed parallel beta-helix repeat-containing protein [Candidatus Acidoferrum sp.]|nr:right-handed parallel beta-helix repeat-containing protein [Candidatus Acidoferrum sp.]